MSSLLLILAGWVLAYALPVSLKQLALWLLDGLSAARIAWAWWRW